MTYAEESEMERIERKLFVTTAVGIGFQLGFSSLLLAAAKARGREAGRWLGEFEEKVLEDARRMKVAADVPEAVVSETVETMIAEFRFVFDSVRAELFGEPQVQVAEERRRPSPFKDARIHLCGRGPGQV
jgi:hypothetical protein